MLFKRAALFLLLLAATALTGSLVHGKTLSVNGYTVEIDWAQSGRNVYFNGRIADGKPCDKLAVYVRLLNTYDRSFASMQKTIRYRKINGVSVAERDRIATDESLRDQWVYNVANITCHD